MRHGARPNAGLLVYGWTRQKLSTTPVAVPVIVAVMTDYPPLPDFGDELGLYRLVRWAQARVRVNSWPSAERAAILAEIERQYRAALKAEAVQRQCGRKPKD